VRIERALVLLAAVALAACQRAEQATSFDEATEAGRSLGEGRPDRQAVVYEIDESAPPQTPETPPEPRSRDAVQRAEELLPQGSPPEAVLKLLGEPESKEGGVWKYGFNYKDADITIQVAFGSDGKVSRVKMIFDPLCM
jgi:hypothetical protein